jgi:hypothetical protein
VADDGRRGTPLDVQDLLRVDVHAEIDKLAHGHLQGDWQIPAELVRRAVGGGAQQVDLSVRGHEVVVADDGAPIARADLEMLAVVLGGNAAPDRLQAALEALESGAGAPLLAASTAARAFQVDTADGDGTRLTFDKRGVSVQRHTGTRTNVVRLTGDLHPAKATQWLRDACRFAQAQVRINGAVLPTGFAGAAAARRLTTPTGWIALADSPSGMELWLLDQGIVLDRISRPQEFPCHAAVEVGHTHSGNLEAAREAAMALLPELRQAVVDLLAEVARNPESLSSTELKRVRDTVLKSLAVEPGLPVLAALRVIPAATPGGTSFLSINDLVVLKSEATFGGVFEPAIDAPAIAEGQPPVLLLDDRHRTALAELLDVAIVTRRDLAPALSWAGHMAPALRWLSGLFRVARPAKAEDLTLQEAGLQRALNEVFGASATPPAQQASFVAGRRAPFVRRGALMLPRDNPQVRAAAGALAQDRRWVYPACLSLVPGAWFPTSARGPWLDLMGASDET